MTKTSMLTAEAVAGWFGPSRFGEPDKEAVRTLTDEITTSLTIRNMGGGADGKVLRDLQNQLAVIRKGAKALSRQLGQLEAGAQKAGFADDAMRRMVATAVGGLAPFAELPPESRGRDGEWIKSAARWAPLVVACLAKPGKAPPSITTPAGPVAVFLAKAVKHIYGKEVHADAVARRLQEIGTEKIWADHAKWHE